MRAFYFQLYILSKKRKEKKERQKRVMLPQPCCCPVRGLQLRQHAHAKAHADTPKHKHLQVCTDIASQLPLYQSFNSALKPVSQTLESTVNDLVLHNKSNKNISQHFIQMIEIKNVESHSHLTEWKKNRALYCKAQ